MTRKAALKTERRLSYWIVREAASALVFLDFVGRGEARESGPPALMRAEDEGVFAR